MYESHWSLNSRPFENRYQHQFYYPSEVHQAALLKLRYTIENRRATAVVCGSSGMGKSLLLASLETQLPEFASPIITVAYPLLDASGFLRYVGRAIAGQDAVGPTTTPETAVAEIERCLCQNVEAGRQTVLVVDEAHVAEQNGLLEPLRMLLNLGSRQSQGESAITIILCGQPTLLPQISRNVSLDERVAVRCVLSRFSIDETSAYIGHRLRAAGCQTDSIFETCAIEQIYHLSDGIPRKINRLCDLALMIGYAQESGKINAEMVSDVHRELSAPATAD